MTEQVVFTAASGAEVSGRLAIPAGNDVSRSPALILVHEAFGLNTHIEALAVRFASLGFLTLAVDLFGGKTAETLGPAMELVKVMKTAEAMEIIAGAVKLLASHSRGNSKVGITGFCLGGGMALAAACNVEGLSASVPFYGLPLPQFQDWSRAQVSQVPIQGHFSTSDPHITKDRVQAATAAAVAAGVNIQIFFYEGGHGFMRDTDPEAYHAESARLAWERMLAFLRKNLSITPTPIAAV